MLKYESRKLHDLDMSIVQTRQKRLDTKRKHSILMKGQEAEDAI
jgi:hypothetical protein